MTGKSRQPLGARVRESRAKVWLVAVFLLLAFLAGVTLLHRFPSVGAGIRNQERIPHRNVREAGRGDYTGVVVDARGLNLSTGLFPRIYDTTGRVIYNGRGRFLPEDAILFGSVEFLTSLTPAPGLLRVGANPLILKAVRARPEPEDPTFKPHVVISVKDADRLLGGKTARALLDRCQIAFLIDSPLSDIQSEPLPPTSPLRERLGIRPPLWERLKRYPGISSVLATIPAAMVAMYREMTPQDKAELAAELRGTTGFLVFQVSNRDAFMKGEILGQNTFDMMDSTVDAKYQGGQITRAKALWKKRGISIFRTLTPAQRDAIATLMEEDAHLASRGK